MSAIQLRNPAHGKSKGALARALEEAPEMVRMRDHSLKTFSAKDMAEGESVIVVRDWETRRRFATVQRVDQDHWVVR